MPDTYSATYISTASTSELAYFFEEAAEELTATVAWALAESYAFLNERLDTIITVPVRKERTTGEYHRTVRRAQAMIAVAMLRERKLGFDSEEVEKSWAAARAAIEDILNFKAHFEEQSSGDELGIGYARPATANTSTGTILVDRRLTYTADREKLYTLTITTAGAVETAVYKWDDGEGNETTAVTSHYEWEALEEGLYIRFLAATGQTYILNNTWTIRCLPLDEIETQSGGLRTIPISK